MAKVRSVCVFCGAQNNIPQTYFESGAEFGRLMAEKDLRLVYGGGDCGVMGAVANAVMAGGGKVTGVFPESLKHIENEHQSLTEIILVGGMHERKQLMFDRSEAVVVLPGGFGTLDEMFEILTWKQLRLHDKPVIIFNQEGYWDHLVQLMDNIINVGFARPETRAFYKVATSVQGIFDALGVK